MFLVYSNSYPPQSSRGSWPVSPLCPRSSWWSWRSGWRRWTWTSASTSPPSRDRQSAPTNGCDHRLTRIVTAAEGSTGAGSMWRLLKSLMYKDCSSEKMSSSVWFKREHNGGNHYWYYSMTNFLYFLRITGHSECVFTCGPLRVRFSRLCGPLRVSFHGSYVGHSECIFTFVTWATQNAFSRVTWAILSAFSRVGQWATQQAFS